MLVQFYESMMAFPGILLGLPWARLLYSAALLFIMGFFGSQLYHIWFDRTLFIGRFEFFDEGSKKDKDGEAFTSQIIQKHRLLVALMQAEYDRRGKLPKKQEQTPEGVYFDTVLLPIGIPPVGDPKSGLAEVDISVQGVNLNKVLIPLRRAISMPNEVSGMVHKSGKDLYASVQWPLGPTGAKAFQVPAQSDTSAASFQVACSIIWAQTRSIRKEMELVPRQEFCDWAEAWRLYDLVRSRSLIGKAWDENDRKSMASARKILDRVIDAGPSYAEVYRLRADIIAVSPDAKPEDRTLAAEDLRQYTLRTSPPKPVAASDRELERRHWRSSFETLGKPIVTGGKLPDIDELPKGWAEGRPEAREKFEKAARGTGRLITRDSPAASMATAFVVGPDLMMTASFVVNTKSPIAVEFEEQSRSRRLPVSEVVFTDEGKHVAILRVPGLDEELHPPLDLAGKAPDGDLSNRRLCVIGYAYPDPRLPSAVQSSYFGSEVGVKRVMPGEVTEEEGDTIVYDSTTTPGTAGGPVIDMETGKAIALHWGRLYSDSRSKGVGTPMWGILADRKVRQALGRTE